MIVHMCVCTICMYILQMNGDDCKEDIIICFQSGGAYMNLHQSKKKKKTTNILFSII